MSSSMDREPAIKEPRVGRCRLYRQATIAGGNELMEELLSTAEAVASPSPDDDGALNSFAQYLSDTEGAIMDNNAEVCNPATNDNGEVGDYKSVPEVILTGSSEDDAAGDTTDKQAEEEDSPDVTEEVAERRFHEFTRDSYCKLLQREEERKRKEEVTKNNESEGRLVDGEIVFDDVQEESAKIAKDPKLADGQPLPEKLGRFPKELEGIPLEDIDPHIEEKSFVIISKKFRRHHIFRFSATRALFCLTPWNPLRRFCLTVITNQWFDWFILLTIAVNCGFMMVQPSDLKCMSYRTADGVVHDVTSGLPMTNITSMNATCTDKVNYIGEVPENVFQAIYTIEMLLKLCARGLILNKYTYLRDGWNWLDFTVVVIAYVTLIIEESNEGGNSADLTGVRAFRVLRALKSISVVPGLRTIVNALLKSLKMLGEVMLLTFFCISVFALLALQLYKGTLRMKCVAEIPATYPFCNATYPSNGSTTCFNSDQTLRTYWLQDKNNYLKDAADEFVLCAATDDIISGCPKGYFCVKAGDNPNWNYTHFDQFFMAMLNTFQLVSLDFWEDTYNKIVIVNGPWNILFFLTVVLLGSFYLLNLMLAVVFMAYEQEADVEAKLAKEEEEEEKAKAKRKENTALLFDPKKLKEQLLQRQEEEANKLAMQRQEEEAAKELATRNDDGDDDGDCTDDAEVKTAEGEAAPKFRARITSSISIPNSPQTSPSHAAITKPVPPVKNIPAVSADEMRKPASTPAPKKLPIKRPTTAHGQFLKTSTVHPGTEPAVNGALQEEGEALELTEIEGSTENVRTAGLTVNPGNTDEQETNEEDSFYDDLPSINGKDERYLIQKYATLWLNRIRQEDDHLIDRNCLCCAKSGLPTYHFWMKWQHLVYKVANDGLFELFITLCIAVNTAIMASEHYSVCELCRLCIANTTCTVCHSTCDLEVDSQLEWRDGMLLSHSKAMNVANVVFTIIFTVEAVIKLTALSKEYFSVGWNVFDLVIVGLSLPDLIIYFLDLKAVNGLDQVAGIIKIFRLLRIVKLAQSWSTMRNLLAIIFGAFGALVNLSLILVIIMFIFAVLGNQLFGKDYAKYEDIVANPELADYGGQLPRWHFNTFPASILMVFRVLCGEWVEPLWDCMRVANQVGCVFLFLLTLILGNFMIFNLFLALLLNSFSTDKIKKDKSEEEESKIKKSLKRIHHCFKSSPCCRSNSDGENYPEEYERSNGEISQPVTRLQAILGERKPSITINGSLKSLKSLIEATEPKHDLGKSGMNLADDKSVTDISSYVSNGLELKPIMRNGHAKSRSGSIISTLSNGTGTSNGVLRNRSGNMSPCNLQQIEKAFSTQRDQYAKFETAVNATAGGCHNPGRSPVVTPIIIAEDFSSDERKTVRIIDVDDESVKADDASDARSNRSAQSRASISKDDEEEMVAEDGHILLPDCLCIVCHRNPSLDGCCTRTWTNFRMLCAKIITHRVFEGFILLLIGASTIALCFEDIYLHENPELVAALNYLNIVFAIFFFIEMLLKMLALGLKKYFTGFWSILDFIIVGVSLVDIAGIYFNFVDISAVRVMRTLRALRPLRAVSRWESMTIIVNALIFAMPAIANVLLVCIVFWLIFVIMGVQAFRGRFHQCELNGQRVMTYPTGYDCDTVPLPVNLDGQLTLPVNFTGYRFPPTLTDCNSSILTPLLGDQKADQWHWAKLCMIMGGTWKKPFIHFDHLGASYLALYQTATFEGWMEVMESAIDHNPTLGGQALRELSAPWYLYFVVFIIFGAFFTLNLFIGVIIDNFNVLKRKYDGSYLAMFLTDQQRHYYNTLKKLGNKKPQKTIRRPKRRIQAIFFDIATNTKFEISITSVILLNMIAMMIEYEPQTVYGSMSNEGSFIPNSVSSINYKLLLNVLEYINIIFTGVFVIEAAIKIIGLRLHYFRRAWNVFDFVVVFLSVLGIILDKLLHDNVFISPTLLRVVRVFRIGRVLRLVKAAKGIRKLLFALVISIPALFNIATLLFLFMFIFAIVGMTFFSHVKHRGALTSTVNFETFGRSILLLFRLSTSAGWNDVLDPLMEDTDCNSTHYIDSLGVPQARVGGDCSIQPLAIGFFLLYLFITFMVIINMYIAVILENFNQAHEQEEIGITEDDFDMFYAIWERYDPHATQYIKLESLPEFISELEAPLGIPKPNGMAIVSFNLPIVEGERIHCLDVLMALVKKVLHGSDEETANMSEEHKDANDQLRQQIADKYRTAFPHRQHVKVLTTTMQRKKEDVAAKTLQRAWRKHKMKQNILRIRELALETASNQGSMSRRLSDAVSTIKGRIGSAFSRISRRASARSTKSIELPKNNELSPISPKRTTS